MSLDMCPASQGTLFGQSALINANSRSEPSERPLQPESSEIAMLVKFRSDLV